MKYLHLCVSLCILNISYNSRENARKATLVIQMNGNSTEIKNPDDMSAEPKRFAFDHSYWSHDGYNERSDGYLEPSDSKYADQVKSIII